MPMAQRNQLKQFNTYHVLGTGFMGLLVFIKLLNNNAFVFNTLGDIGEMCQYLIALIFWHFINIKLEYLFIHKRINQNILKDLNFIPI